MSNLSIYAIIPARAGSKGVKNKNIRLLSGQPLIAYSIKSALESTIFNKIIVSTDSDDIAKISKDYGAEVPFLRPKEYSTDQATDRAYIEHFLDWCKKYENKEPDLIAILRPTTPVRDNKVLATAVNMILDNLTATSLRSVHALSEPPQKMLQIVDNWLTGFFPEDKRDDYFNLPRQSFPVAYHPNGYIDIVKSNYIRSEKEKIFGSKMLGFVTPFSVEIDNNEDFMYLEYILNKMEKV